MNYRKLGNSEIFVSPIGIGGNIFGYICNETQTYYLLDYARDHGVNFIDTADVYSNGASEFFIGKAVRSCRHHWVIATKIGVHSDTSPLGLGTKRNILSRIDRSLKRLQTDYIDLYQIHHYDEQTTSEETLEAFEILKEQGKIKYAGCSNYDFKQLTECVRLSKINNWTGYISTQVHYNMLKRDIEQGILQLCEHNNIGMLVYGALGRGVLTDKYISGRNEEYIPRAALSRLVDKDLTHLVLDKVKKINTYAKDKFNVTIRELALAWLLRTKAVTSLIVGVRTPEQLQQNVDSLGLHLTETDLEELDNIVGNINLFQSVSLGNFIQKKQFKTTVNHKSLAY